MSQSKQRLQYVKISDQQRVVLSRFFEEQGMTSTRKDVIPVIQKAAQETGLSEERVKKWISNEKRKRTATKPTEPEGLMISKQARLPTFKRGPSSYNLFCSEFFRSGQCKGVSNEEKYRLAGEAWKRLSAQEVDKFHGMSKKYKFPSINGLSEDTRRKLIKEHKKQMLEQAYFLEDLGCESSILFLEDSISSGVDMGGSSEGSFFLRSNPSIYMKFAQHFSTEYKHYNYKDVQELFNDKYSKAMGKNMKVPYGKGGFRVINIPDGIDFKKPSSYGRKQIEQIMAAREKIQFEILPWPVNSDQDADVDEPMQTTNKVIVSHDEEDLVHSTIKAVVGVEAAKFASKTTPFGEEAVEVENLVLTQDQRLTLYSYSRSFFSCNAWLAIGANLVLEEPEIPGIILPVYTSAENENFWLFYTEEKLRKIEKISPSGSLYGFWLELLPDSPDKEVYKVLAQHKEKVYGKNIIKSEHGPLYFFHHFTMSSSQTQFFSMPNLFRTSILNILTLSGIISSDE